jgi:type IV pilus assembly protein PilA
MLQRFRKMRERGERGFTLIELLVVILIIAILAAIAIPVFLRQREKGYRSQLESALKNAATAEESYLTTSPTDDYTAVEADLVAEGLKKAAGVNALNITISGGQRFCVSGTHADLPGLTMAVSSDDSEPTVGGCAAAGVKAAPPPP